ncbi:MAG: DegT/DnrJ/EryC1/StrS family aminotransferase [Acidobacteriota bacterium]
MVKPRTSKQLYVPFHVPSIDHSDSKQVLAAVESGWLTSGPKVSLFERRAGEFVGASNAIALKSCTAALHLALVAAGIGPGDEVITTPYTFAATGEAILHVGARPVFADIEPRTLNIDPAAVERAVTPRTKAVVPVHIAGLACAMEAIRRIAKRRHLRVVEDAAHAFGATCRGKPIGSAGDMTCFSFYATKNLTTGEGGMLTTSSKRVADRVRRLALHGMTRDAFKRRARAGAWRYDILEMGFKYNMTDLAAGLGLAQLAKFGAMQRRRRRIARRYQEALGDLDACDLPVESSGSVHAWHLYILRLRPRVLRVSRDEMIEKLRRKGIGTSVHFQPLHLHTFYRKTFGHRRGSFPVTERESSRALSLPLYPSLSGPSQDRVIEVLSDLVTRYRR